MRFISTIFLLIIYQLSISQSSHLIGNIVNSETKEPICYANITFENKGSSSNEYGIFVLKLNSEIKESDSIKISCIGFQSKAILIKDLLIADTSTILLIPVVYDINGLSVEAEYVSPYEILQNAFKKIKTNNSKEKTYFKVTLYEKQSYYDDSHDTDRNREIYISSYLEDPGYIKSYNKIRGVKEKFFINGIFIANNYGLLNNVNVGPTAHKHLLIENPLRYKKKDAIFNDPKSYKYSIQKAYFDSTLKKNILVLDISAIDTTSKFGKCKVYISSGDYKIFRIDLEYEYEKDIKYNRKSGDNVSGDKDYFYSIEYILNKKGKMELKRITMEFGAINLNSIKNHVNYSSTWKCELKIIEAVDLDILEIQKSPRLDNNENVFNQKIINDKSYWLDYNLIIKK